MPHNIPLLFAATAVAPSLPPSAMTQSPVPPPPLLEAKSRRGLGGLVDGCGDCVAVAVGAVGRIAHLRTAGLSSAFSAEIRGELRDDVANRDLYLAASIPRGSSPLTLLAAALA
jgi:hypothetical protein